LASGLQCPCEQQRGGGGVVGGIGIGIVGSARSAGCARSAGARDPRGDASDSETERSLSEIVREVDEAVTALGSARNQEEAEQTEDAKRQQANVSSEMSWYVDGSDPQARLEKQRWREGKFRKRR
jgi:hypothetical protein